MRSALALPAPEVTHFTLWVVLFRGEEPQREGCILKRTNQLFVVGFCLLAHKLVVPGEKAPES